MNKIEVNDLIHVMNPITLEMKVIVAYCQLENQLLSVAKPAKNL